MKLFDSELRVMNILWKEGSMAAKDIALIVHRQVGWNKNTTYTIIKRCIEKKAISRVEPNFMCVPLIEKETVQDMEMAQLIDKMFDGSVNKFFAAFSGNMDDIPQSKIQNLRKLIKELR